MLWLWISSLQRSPGEIHFIYTNEVKPHVLFKFNHSILLNHSIRSVRLSMKLGEGPREPGPGACKIKLCGYTDRTISATAGFQFELRGTRTLEDRLG